MQKAKNKIRPNNNLLMELWWKFWPFWPLFLLLIVLSVTGAWFYLRYTVPVYEAGASVIIKDQNKGVDDSKEMEALNPFATKKTVENEIEVIKSRAVMGEVVKNLNLVAPIFEKTKTKTIPAYETSPVKIVVANVDSIVEVEKVDFQYNEKNRTISFNNKNYSLNQWISTRFGKIKFVPNQNGVPKTKNPLYFSLLSAVSVTNDYVSRLSVTPTSKLSTVLTLQLKDASAKRAENVLDALVTAYDIAAVKEKNSTASNTLRFVEDRLNKVSGELDTIEHEIQQFKSEKGATDISSQGQLFLQNVSENDQKLSEVNMKLSVLDQVEKYLVAKDQKGSIVPSTLGVEDPLLSGLLNKLYENELEYDKLKETYAENHPMLLSVREQINRIKPSILENIRNQRKSLQASRGNLNVTNSTYTTQLQTIPEKERQLLEISREQGIKTSIYNFLLQKREEAALSQSSAVSNGRLLDKAEAGLFPVWPKKGIIYPAAVLVALIIGCAVIVLLEVFNRKIVSRNDLELLSSMPIIGELGYQKAKSPFVIGEGKHSFLAEQFRKLRTSLPYLGINSIKKKILITSSISGEGKSFTALNLGLSVALAGKKVVLIELDLINPTLTKRLGLEPTAGITNYLNDEADLQSIIRKTDKNKNLYLIPAGDLTDNPSELILNGKIEGLFKTLEEQFDVILVDTAPVGLISDAYFLSPLCDATLFIVRNNFTPKVLIQRIEDEKDVYEMQNVAIVYNGVNSKGISGEYYSYGYNYLEKEERKISKIKRNYLS